MTFDQIEPAFLGGNISDVADNLDARGRMWPGLGKEIGRRMGSVIGLSGFGMKGLSGMSPQTMATHDPSDAIFRAARTAARSSLVILGLPRAPAAEQKIDGFLPEVVLIGGMGWGHVCSSFSDGCAPPVHKIAGTLMLNQNDALTVAYVYHLDANDPSAQSGRPFAILDGLRRSHVSVLPVFPLRHTHLLARIARKVEARLLGNFYLFDRNPGLLRDFGREASGRLRERDFDVVFSPSTLPLSFLESEIPVTISADATFRSMVDYYPGFSRLSQRQREFSERMELRVLQGASLLIYPSEWAAKSAISHYGVAKERVVVLPSGANFGARNRRDDALRWIGSRPRSGIRLLFVGRQWKRKGGDIAFDAMRILKHSGVNVRLDIVGCTPPYHVSSHESVVAHGLLSSSNEAQRKEMESLFAQAHFLIVPSRAEAYGLIFCEANAFGVPAISSDTGGISTIVRDGINGYKLPLEAGAAEYATLIAEIAGDTVRYQNLALSSFGEFDSRLNWEKWIETYLKIVSKIVSNRPSHSW